MSILKRPEVWVLLILAVVGVGYVMTTGGGGEDPADGGAGTAVVAGKLAVQKIELTRDYGNARLDLKIRYDNRGGAEIAVMRPDVALLRGDVMVDEFFLAGDFPAPIAADSQGAAVLKYWLKPEDLTGALVLRVKGDTVVVKGEGTFDLESVENQKSVTLSAGQW